MFRLTIASIPALILVSVLGCVPPAPQAPPLSPRAQPPPPAIRAAAGQGGATILVAYYSVDGHTQAMAAAVARGAQSVNGARVKLLAVKDAKADDVLEADAIIVGSPVYNANIAPQVQEFINGWPFNDAPLKDKLGAAFVTAGGLSAGEELAQMSILRSMLIFGMVVAGGPQWQSAFGASAIVAEDPSGQPSDKDRAREAGFIEPYYLQKGEALGKRIAELAIKLKR